MAAVVSAPRLQGGSAVPGWQRKYPPMLAVLVGLAIVLTVLPSSLNIEQPNPSQTLEFAPVPPDDSDAPPPPDGNFASLGLGTSDGLDGGGAEGDGPGGPPETTPPTFPGGTPPPPVGGGSPSTKTCVGDPPRQTEDPLSPPCVAFFEGDNFGATYQGVTGEEIRLLYYIDGGIAELGCSSGSCPRPTGEFYDLFEPENPEDATNRKSKHPLVSGLRVWQRYFNERFQTYGRTVHFYVGFGPSQPVSPEERRADAAAHFLAAEPFAVISDAGDNQDAYLEAMAAKGVLNFGALFGRPADFFQRFPKLIWGYFPSLEQQADQYSSYVCQKVVDQPSVLNGNTDQIPGSDAGKPRVFGALHTSDEDYPGLRLLAETVKQKVKACGVELAGTALFPECCYAKDNSMTHEYANQSMAEFQQKGITTILWLGGINGYYGPAADSLGYQPEWIVLGDSQLEGNNPPRLMTATNTFDGRAVVITPLVFEPALNQQLCYQAFRQVASPDYPETDVYIPCALYENLFQFFVGVQVAGPRLGPTSMDQGYHAIPAVRSPDVRVPACFYLPNDYTCVKDAQAEIYDARGQAPGDSRAGCWRSIEGGRRYLPGDWPPGNIDAQLTGDEPCNGYNTGVLVRTI